jgi:regulatory protein
MFAKKEITEEKALQRLAALCAKAEHCSGEMIEKMRRWGLDDEQAQARIMAYLTKHKYIDDERFARAFINDKVVYNKWGRRKIAQALRMKHVDESIYEPILDEVEEDKYLDVLCPLIEAKMRTIKAKNDYEMTQKLMRFAAGRGFDFDMIKRAIGRLMENVDDFD